MVYVIICHKGHGTKFGIYGTNSTKFWCRFPLEVYWWQANLMYLISEMVFPTIHLC